MRRFGLPSGPRRRRPFVLSSAVTSLALYLWSVLAALGAGLTWHLVHASLGSDPFPLFALAVGAAAFLGGVGPGLMAAATVMALTVLLRDSAAAFHFTDRQYVEFALYSAAAAGIGWPQRTARNAESNLRQGSALVDTIAGSSGEGICAVDAAGRVIFLNPTAERLLDWTGDEMRGKDLHEALHRCGRTSPCELRRTLHDGQPARAQEAVFRTRRGYNLSVMYGVTPVQDGGERLGAVITFQDITEQKRTMETLHSTRERYTKLVRTSPDSVIVTDLYNFVVIASDRAAELYGFSSPEAMVGLSAMEIIAPQDRVRAAQDKQHALREGPVRDVEYEALRLDGSTFPIEASTSLLVGSDGLPEALITVARDRTERKRAERSARAAEACTFLQYASAAVLAESTSLGDAIPKILQTICQGAGWQIGIFWSPGRNEDSLRCRFLWHVPGFAAHNFELLCRQLTFAPGSGGPGRVWTSGQPHWEPDVLADGTFTRALAASKDGLRGSTCIPVPIEGKVHAVLEFFSSDARPVNQEFMDMMVRLGGQIGHFIKRRQQEEALEHAAYHDPLTNLANRLLFKGRVDRAILAAWPDNKSLAVLLMDLNKFKHVNDTFGHQYGDIILQQTGTRLRNTLRESDTVARLGGDEFAVLLPGSDETGAAIVARKIVDALTQPIHADGMTFHVGASIGIALYPQHGEDTDTLLHRADVAMYCAKRRGGGFLPYDEQQDEAFEQRRGSA